MKNLILLSILFVSCGVCGQNTALDALTDAFERSRDMSLAYVDAMPENAFNSKPTPEVRSFAEQMLHASQGIFNLVSNGSGAKRPYAGTNLEKDQSLHNKTEVRRIVKESYEYALAQIKTMDPSSLDQVIEKGPMRVSRINWVRKANEHAGHHRGQCVIYLRLAGVEPPPYQLF